MVIRAYLALLILLFVALAACGGAASLPPATEPPTSAPAVSPDGPFAGPLVGFFFEDTYEDAYFAVFDVASGALRVLADEVPLYPGEVQWFDGGCRLLVHGRLLNLNGQTTGSVPPAALEHVSDVNTARLSPDRSALAGIVAAGAQTGAAAAAADVDLVSLSSPYTVTRLTSRGGADSRALAWSPNGEWLYFTDYDAGGARQIYRAAKGTAAVEQLTAHNGPVAAIDALAPSPDGRYLAYGVRNLTTTVHPYLYRPEDEGWVGIIDLSGNTAAVARPAKFASVEPGRGLVWDAAGDTLLIIGDSLPVAADDPAAGRQVHWVTPNGQIRRSLTSAAAPGGYLGWIAPLGSVDSLLAAGRDGFLLYDDEGGFRAAVGSEAPPLGAALGRRTIGVLPAPLSFPGETACATP